MQKVKLIVDSGQRNKTERATLEYFLSLLVIFLQFKLCARQVKLKVCAFASAQTVREGRARQLSIDVHSIEFAWT